MRISLDVVDLLQLQEIWSRRPIVTAFTRLESRSTPFPVTENFAIEDLMPRLARLKRSPAWLSRRPNPALNDPARVPLSDLSDEYLIEMYPDVVPVAKRSSLFQSVYNCYLVANFKETVMRTAAALQLLARVRQFETADRLDAGNLPAEGSPEWIPLTITDEIRALDDRYDAAEPGSPSTYVVAEDFWSLLLKAEPEHIEGVTRLALEMSDAAFCSALRNSLHDLIALAHTWYRSPSLVGLCYMQKDNKDA
ncbi:MAG: hypothetical protein LCI00_20870 [Chloroflexi bacterium]|nr:hypothetical protein [Chloroflexota bacterium]MCC6892439.1 hypothetical protein [Anaerolineae bacterium]